MTARNLNKIVNSLSDAQKNALAHLSVIGGTVEEVDMNKYDGKVSAWQRQEWDDKAGYNIRSVLNNINPTTWTSLNKKGLVSGTRKEGGRNRWSHTQTRDKMQSLQLTPLGYLVGDMVHQNHAVDLLNSRNRRLAARFLVVQKVASGEWEFTNPEEIMREMLNLSDTVKMTLDHTYDWESKETNYGEVKITLTFKYGISVQKTSRPYVSSYQEEPQDSPGKQWDEYTQAHGIYSVVVGQHHPLETGYKRALNTSHQVLQYAQELIEAQRVCDLVNLMSDHSTGLITKTW